jgi:hypothetical protein
MADRASAHHHRFEHGSITRRFVIMGFSYERGVGEMLENMGHRAESIMEKTFEKLTGEDNLWKRFTRYEKTHPGRAALGNVHFAPKATATMTGIIRPR